MENEFEVYQILSDEYLLKKDCLSNHYSINLPYNINVDFNYTIGETFSKEKAEIAAKMTAEKLRMSGLFD